ncbi:MAG: methionyl-tRNA formyltransferase [Rhizobiales bacterium]|nr:methionyl-tRNA formyltransferase [Hyphomicrobiales bacterium]
MRSVLIGAVESSEVALRTMTAAGWKPDLVVTLPPERQGRHSDFVDLSEDAGRLDIPICHSANINDEGTLQRLEALAPDYIFVIGWSQICGPRFLEVAARGTIGYHPAPLPQMRGRAVIPWTILKRETRSGSTLFWIDAGMDTGPILAQHLFDLGSDETAASLYRKHMQALAAMLPEALDALLLTSPPKRAQDHARATYCARRRPADGLIDWQKPADDVLLLIRAVGTPYPGAFTSYRDSKLTVFDARPAVDGHRYIGLPGQIQAVDAERLVVCCGDGQCLELIEWSLADGRLPSLHDKLGAV